MGLSVVVAPVNAWTSATDLGSLPNGAEQAPLSAVLEAKDLAGQEKGPLSERTLDGVGPASRTLPFIADPVDAPPTARRSHDRMSSGTLAGARSLRGNALP